MTTGGRKQDESGAELMRGIGYIMLVGIVLGAGFNVMQLASGPRKGLAWIRREVKLASLESLTSEATAATTPAADSAPAQAAPASAADSSGRSTPVTTAAAGAHPKSTKDGSAKTAAGPGQRGTALPPRTSPAPVSANAATPSHVPGAPAPAPPTTSSVAGSATATKPAVSLPVVPDASEPMEVQVALVRKFWDAGAAVFVDARSPEEYAEGHIPGAVSLPFDDVFKDPDKAKHLETHGRPVVITYCGGGDCDLSRNLALALIDAGHKKVLVFMGGEPGWKESGSPVVTGTSPGTAP